MTISKTRALLSVDSREVISEAWFPAKSNACIICNASKMPAYNLMQTL